MIKISVKPKSQKVHIPLNHCALFLGHLHFRTDCC